MANKDLNKIKEALTKSGKTGVWLAKKVHKTPTTISKWCSNKTQPSFEMLMEIAQLLDVDVRDIYIRANKKEES